MCERERERKWGECVLERGESMYVFLLEKEECESVSLIERGKCV